MVRRWRMVMVLNLRNANGFPNGVSLPGKDITELFVQRELSRICQHADCQGCDSLAHRMSDMPYIAAIGRIGAFRNHFPFLSTRIVWGLIVGWTCASLRNCVKWSEDIPSRSGVLLESRNSLLPYSFYSGLSAV